MFGRRQDVDGAQLQPGARRKIKGSPFFSGRLFGNGAANQGSWSRAHTEVPSMPDRDRRKFGVSAHPLAKEWTLKDMRPLPQDLALQVDAFHKAYEREARARYNERNTNGSSGKHVIHQAELEEIGREKARHRLESFDKQAQEVFIHDFRNWLAGMGKAEDYVRGGIKLQNVGQGKPLSRHDSVLTYLEETTGRVMDYEKELMKLKLRMGRGKYGEPPSLSDCYKYFKYIVRGQPYDPQDFVAEEDVTGVHGAGDGAVPPADNWEPSRRENFRSQGEKRSRKKTDKGDPDYDSWKERPAGDSKKEEADADDRRRGMNVRFDKGEPEEDLSSSDVEPDDKVSKRPKKAATKLPIKEEDDVDAPFEEAKRKAEAEERRIAEENAKKAAEARKAAEEEAAKKEREAEEVRKREAKALEDKARAEEELAKAAAKEAELRKQRAEELEKELAEARAAKDQLQRDYDRMKELEAIARKPIEEAEAERKETQRRIDEIYNRFKANLGQPYPSAASPPPSPSPAAKPPAGPPPKRHV